MLICTKILSQVSCESQYEESVAEFETEKLVEDACKEISNNIQIIRCGAHTLQLAVIDHL